MLVALQHSGALELPQERYAALASDSLGESRRQGGDGRGFEKSARACAERPSQKIALQAGRASRWWPADAR